MASHNDIVNALIDAGMLPSQAPQQAWEMIEEAKQQPGKTCIWYVRETGRPVALRYDPKH